MVPAKSELKTRTWYRALQAVSWLILSLGALFSFAVSANIFQGKYSNLKDERLVVCSNGKKILLTRQESEGQTSYMWATGLEAAQKRHVALLKLCKYGKNVDGDPPADVNYTITDRKKWNIFKILFQTSAVGVLIFSLLAGALFGLRRAILYIVFG